MNLVLDLDGTLINATDSLDKVVPRPYLDRFLCTSFQHFSSVSIWTASSEFWCKQVLENVINPILVSVSHTLGRKCEFRHIMYDQHCNVYTLPNGKFAPIKPLAKMYNYWFTANNTIIVDDTPITFMNNERNGIHIPTFVGSNDRMLLLLEQYLWDLLVTFQQTGTFTLNLNVKPWYVDPSRTHRANIVASQYQPLPDYMDLSD